MPARSGTASLSVVLAALAAGCAGESDTLAFNESTTPATIVVAQPEVEFSVADQGLIAFHSTWVCEFQRRTFAEPTDGDQARADALTEAGIPESTYTEFLARLDDEQELRSAVLFDFQQHCRP